MAGILLSKIMNVTYHIHHIISDAQFNIVHTTNILKKAIDYLQYHCDINPEGKFQLVKTEVIEEVIAESNDHRQQTFEFI